MSSIAQSGDLKNRIIFTLLLLSVYRFGTFVPLPGIDPDQLKTMMEGNQKGLLGMFNVFAGVLSAEWLFLLRYNAIYFILNYCSTFDWCI